ncbi:plasminogen-like, partial [Anneissia japonica]|uniref:plasminogen-like n=1 Tax=Anneissia japonica TaxID=1529436 RepID=UPI001425BA75
MELNTHRPIMVILKTMLYVLVFVICFQQIQGQWDCVDLIGKQYYGYYNSACTKPRSWCQNCTRWVDLNATLYDIYNYTESDENYCRWPDPDDSSGPWCYYEDESGNIEKEFCHIEPCS